MRKILAVAFFFLMAMMPAWAGQCTGVWSSGIVFGNYSGAQIAVSGTVSVLCPVGVSYSLGMDAGSYGTSVYSRQMMSNGSYLSYQMYSNAAHTLVWGNSAATGWVSGVGTGVTQSYTVYGLLPGSQVGSAFYTMYFDYPTVTAYVGGVADSSGTFPQVETYMMPHCGIGSSTLNFGTYSGTQLTGTATMQVICGSGVGYTVSLDAGVGSGATTSNRLMTNAGSATLKYSLYRDSGMTLNWGNVQGTDTVAGSGTGATQTITIYGKLPGSQSATTGTYTDTVTATITY